MVATESTPAHDPGKTAFDDPSSGKRAKSFGEECIPVDLLSLGHQNSPLGSREGAHRLHGPAQMLFEPRDKGASIPTIAPDQLHSGIALSQGLKHRFGAFLVRTLGSKHVDFQQVALAINQHRAFAPPDFFFPYRSPFQDLEPHSF